MNKVLKKFLVGFISLGMIIITGSGASFINSNNNSNEVSTKVTEDDENIGSKLETYDSGIFHEDAHWPSAVEADGYALSLDTDGSTYLIKNENDLFFLSYVLREESATEVFNEYKSKSYKVSLPEGEDTLDCTEYNWYPIASNRTFLGNFDGGNATIKIKTKGQIGKPYNYGFFSGIGTFGTPAGSLVYKNFKLIYDLSVNGPDHQFVGTLCVGGCVGSTEGAYFENIDCDTIFTYDQGDSLFKIADLDLGGFVGSALDTVYKDVNVTLSIEIKNNSLNTIMFSGLTVGGLAGDEEKGKAENVTIDITKFKIGISEDPVLLWATRIGLIDGYIYGPVSYNNVFVRYNSDIEIFLKGDTDVNSYFDIGMAFGRLRNYQATKINIYDIFVLPLYSYNNITINLDGTLNNNIGLFAGYIDTNSDQFFDLYLSFVEVILNKLSIITKTTDEVHFACFVSYIKKSAIHIFKSNLKITDSLVLQNTGTGGSVVKNLVCVGRGDTDSSIASIEASTFFVMGGVSSEYTGGLNPTTSTYFESNIVIAGVTKQDFPSAPISQATQELIDFYHNFVDYTSTSLTTAYPDVVQDDFYFSYSLSSYYPVICNRLVYHIMNGTEPVACDYVMGYDPWEAEDLSTSTVNGCKVLSYSYSEDGPFISPKKFYIYNLSDIYVYISMSINYDTDGGTINDVSYPTSFKDETVTLPTNVTKSGFTFNGWYLADGITKITTISQSDGYTHNINVVAKWTDDGTGGDDNGGDDENGGPKLPIGTEFKIIYDTKDGTINDANYPTTYICGVGVTLPTSVTKVNYDFAGWSYRNLNGVIITSISSRQYGDVYLNANYTISENAKKYSIEYVNEAGKINGDYKTSYLDEEVVLPTDVTSDYGTFVGWYDNPEFTGRRIYKISDTDTGNKTYYARYMFKQYMIHYEFDDATGIVEYYYYGDEVTLLNDFTKDGYTFVGLSETKDDDTNLVTKINKGDYGDKTYYVIFKKNETTNYNWIIWVVLGVLVVAAGISVPLIIRKHKKVAK